VLFWCPQPFFGGSGQLEKPRCVAAAELRRLVEGVEPLAGVFMGRFE
jgi:hypothetical protein